MTTAHEKKRLRDGVYAACLTPLKDDLSMDPTALAAHGRWLLSNGCDGLVLLGTTGEAMSFNVIERMDVLDAALESLPPGRLMVGTGACALADAVLLTRHAVQRGVGGVLVMPPFFYRSVHDDGVFAFFDALIQQVGETNLQVYLYHFPRMSGVPFSQALIERLLTRYPETVVGMKDSSGDWQHMKMVTESFPTFRVFAGTERYLLDIMQAGGAGCISATTNVTCRLAAEVFAHCHREDARALQDRLTAVREAIEAYPVIAALKYLTAERTRRRVWLNVRPPLTPLPEKEARILKETLARHDFVM